MAECRGIPGSIGLLRSKIYFYDHNPFWARPYQNITFPFSNTAGAEVSKERDITFASEHQENLQKDTDDKQTVIFDYGDAFLRPKAIRFHTFVATIKREKEAGDTGYEIAYLDFATGLSASNSIENYLPGGQYYNDVSTMTTGKSIFPHEVWIYEGSAIYKTEVRNPSEYEVSLGQDVNWESLSKEAQDKLLSQLGTAMWDMNSESNPEEKDQLNRVYPEMIGRPKCKSSNFIHWTLRKYTPLFQGQDFVIEVMKIDPTTTARAMQTNNPIQELNDNPMQDMGETLWKAFFEPAWKNSYNPYETKHAGPETEFFENGVSNVPYYADIIYDEDNKDVVEEFVQQYYLKNKGYVMIELGVSQWDKDIDYSKRGIHNYFIEMVRGRKPRFFHLGVQLRGFDGEGPTGVKGKATDKRMKLRCLGEYSQASVDDLLGQDHLAISVRQHLGELIITFSNFEHAPWRVIRSDVQWDNNSNQVVDKKVPMVIPGGVIRVHGGNMTMGFAFSPTIYHHEGKVIFRDRQADIGHDEEDRNMSNNMYATFAQPGNADSQKNTKTLAKRRFFTDPQFANLKMGYSADAYYIGEIHRNGFVRVSPYELQPDQYQKIGREFAWEVGGFTGERPHILDIRVIIKEEKKDKEISTFDLSGLDPTILGDDGRHIGQWDVGVFFRAGTIMLHDAPYDLPSITKIGDREIDIEQPYHLLRDCITPIATAWSIIVLGGGKVIKDDMRDDVSSFVESISDGWSLDDGYASMNHEAKLKLYLPVGTGYEDIDSKVTRIMSLIDKAFFVTIAYWWEQGMGLDYSVQSNRSNRWTGLSSDDDPRLIQMTGIAYGAQVERSVNKVKLDIEVKDYMEVLKQTFVWNCPFFDSVSDVSAVYELAKMAGFDNTPVVNDDVPGQQATGGIDRRPLGFMNHLMETTVEGIKEPVIWNEEKHAHMYFALPATYADINNPAMKFSNGTPYRDVMLRLAKLPGKTLYFDRYGVLISELAAGKLTAFRKVKIGSDPDGPNLDIDVQELIKASFVTSPRQKIWDVGSKRYRTFNPMTDTPFLVYNSYQVKRSVADAINHISMYSVRAPDSGMTGLMAKGRTFYEQIWDPEAEGFFGYRKMMWHQDGIYGDDRSMNQAMSFYARFKYPPLQISFETYGVPGLKALDVIMLNRQPIYITEINHDLDPKTNTWWMNISAEWIKSFDDDLLLPDVSDEDIDRPDL